ncbi:MAG: peptide deformylase [Candidatus Peregrinibacteria bacterium]
MPALTVITGADNPILRTQAKKVLKVTKDILKLIKDMRLTVTDEDGAGLAAPQVGQSLSLCLANIVGKMTVFINPVITRYGKEQEVMEEGCLSLPGIVVAVPRSTDVTVKFMDEKGKEQERRLRGFSARVIQHEVDHLEARLIVDYE